MGGRGKNHPMRWLLGGWALNDTSSFISEVVAGFVMSSLSPISSAAYCSHYLYLVILGGFLWAYEQSELQQNTVCAFLDILLKSFTVLAAIKEVGRPRKSFRKVIISSIRLDKLCGLVALRCSFYKELINWTFIWHPFCVWTPLSNFCQFPLQCLSKGLQKLQSVFLGLFFSRLICTRY